MKKKTKQLLALVGVLVVLSAGYVVMEWLPQSEEQEEQEDVIEVTEFSAEEIVAYSFTNPSYSMGFYITANGYVQQEDAEFPVKENSVKNQLNAIGSMTAMQVIDSTDKEEYGLDNPFITIQITLSDGMERNFAVGDKALFESGYYLLDEERNQIYLVSSSECDKFNLDWSYMVEKEEFTKVSSDDILSVTVETDGEQTLYLYYEEEQDSWWITTPEETCQGDNEEMSDALRLFNSYLVATTYEYNCTDFSVYGLEQPKTKVTVQYAVEAETSEETETEHSEREIKTLVFEFGDTEEESEDIFVRINGSSYVYGMISYYANGVSEFDIEELRWQEEEITEETEDTIAE